MTGQTNPKSSSVQKTDPSSKNAQLRTTQRDVHVQQSQAQAQGQAGLNLNILGSLGGSLFSRKTKSNETQPDGSSKEVENAQTSARADGMGAGSLGVQGQGQAQAGKRDVKMGEGFDHLGLESK